MGKKIPIRIKLTIFVVGLITAMMMYLIFQVLFASVIDTFILDAWGADLILFLVILGYEMIIIVVVVPVSLWVSEKISGSVAYKSAIFAVFVNIFLVIIPISYISLIILYPEIFSELSGIDMILAFPTVIVYFSLYVLNNFFYLYMITSVSYFVIYIIFLDIFYD